MAHVVHRTVGSPWLILSKICFIFFLILAFQVSGSPAREDPGYATEIYTWCIYEMNLIIVQTYLCIYKL